MWASRGTSEIPSPPATSPITACQSPARCATRGLKPAARQPAMNTSSHDQPTGGATHSSSAQVGEVDPGAAGERVIGRQDRVEDVAEQLLAVEARCRRGAARREHSIAEDHVDVAGDEHRHRLVGLGLLHAQRDAGRDGAQRPRRGRQQAGQRGREAADPHLAARRCVLRRELALQPLELREQRVGVPEQDVRGGREPDAAPGRLEQRVADLRSSADELLRDRRRREVQRVGRRRERAVVGDGAQRRARRGGRP